MADNAPFADGKNIYTGGEIAQRFLPPIQALFNQRPVPQRMIFELLMELKDLIYMGMSGCTKEVLEWEINNSGTSAFEDLDDTIVRAITPTPRTLDDASPQIEGGDLGPARLLRRKASSLLSKPPKQDHHHQPAPVSFLVSAPDQLLYSLESLETTALACTLLPLSMPDFCAHAIISLRRLVPRPTLTDFAQKKKLRHARCAEFARCAKWAGDEWRQNGGCKRACKNEDEDEENLPSWHRSSRWFDDGGSGTCMVGGGRAVLREDGFGVVRMTAS